MTREVRRSGIDIVGDIPWGTHFCQFYRTEQDLLDIVIPYFKAGLDNNEACLWITSEPLKSQEAEEALENTLTNCESYLISGKMKIIPHDEWYLKDGDFSSAKVLINVLDRLDRARSKGFSGLRITGNASWLEKKDWKGFADYEAVVNTVIGGYPLIALCCYNLDQLDATEATEVIRNHQHVLSRQVDKWEAIKKGGNEDSSALAVGRRRKKAKSTRSPMMTVSEAAEFLGLHVNTVRRWSETGILKSCRLGSLGHRRFLREDLERFLEKQ